MAAKHLKTLAKYWNSLSLNQAKVEAKVMVLAGSRDRVGVGRGFQFLSPRHFGALTTNTFSMRT